MAIADNMTRGMLLVHVRTVFFAICLSLLAVGCDDVVSTSPLIGEGQAIFDQRLLGTWVDHDDDEFTVEPAPGDRYRISDRDDETDEMNVQLTQIGDRLFFQIAETDCTAHLSFKPRDGEHCYMFLDVEIEQNVFSTRWLDHRRVFEDSVAKR